MAACLEALEPRLLLTADWTVMTYMNGDNNLEPAAIANLNQMETVGSTAQVNLVVQLDRSPDYDTTNGNWSGARRGLVTQDSNTSTISSALTSIGSVDMGNPASLTSFIQWAAATYPAQHYALIVWDHGGGLDGVSWDDTSNTHMTIAQAGSALASSGVHFNIVGFDACMMSMAEIGYQIRASADYLVSSEQEIPYDGWPYDTITADLTATPTQSPATLASDIVTRYGQYYSGSETLSAIDLSKVSALATQLDNFAVTAQAQTTSWGDVSAAEQSANYYSNPDYRDLGTFLGTLAGSSTNAAVKTAAQNVQSAYSAAVLSNYSAASEGGTGLSIYLPSQGESVDSTYTAANFALCSATHWEEFLNAFTGGAGGGSDADGQLSTATALGALPAAVSGSVGSDGATFVGGRDVDFYSLTVAAGKTVNFNIDAQETGSSLDSYLRVFDSTGKELASNDDATDPTSGVQSSDSYIQWTAPKAGTYYVAVSGYPNSAYNPAVAGSGQSGSTGAYSLSVSLAGGALDLNGTLATATSLGSAPVNYAAAIGGEPSGAQDVDMYAIRVTKNQKLTFDVVTGGSGLDAYLRLFRTSGFPLAANDNTYGSDPEITYDFTGLTPGIYYVGVSGAGNSTYDPTNLAGVTAGSTGAYTLRIAGAGVHLDFNGTIPMATPVTSLPATLNGSVGDEPVGNMDVDMYAFTAAAGQRLSFNVDAAETGGPLDAVMRLFDATGQELDYSDNATDPVTGVASKDPYLEHTFGSAGTYYVAVSGAPNGNYSPFVESSGVPGSRGNFVLKIQNVVLPTTAGPDASHYIASVVTPTFQNIATTGTVGMFPYADDDYFQLAASDTANFGFKFYGNTYQDFYVSTNGMIAFGGPNTDYYSTDLATPSAPTQAAICPLWDDLVVDGVADSAIDWKVQGPAGNRQLIIQWNDVRFSGGSGLGQITFEAVLNESDGSMQFNYQNLTTGDSYFSDGADAVVGIKDSGSQSAGGNVLPISTWEAPNALVASNKSVRIWQDIIPPTVTINQAVAQPDPTNVSTVNFTAKFNEPVTDFTAADVTLGGTAAGPLSAVVTPLPGGTTYTITVTGMTSDGTVTATIPAGKAHNLGGVANLASTSTDNTITYDTTPPTETINQAATQTDPGKPTSVNFTVVFSKAVTDFKASAVVLGGTAPGTKVATVTPAAGLPGTTYTVSVKGMTGNGTVTADVAGGKVHSKSGSLNLASTSTDNTVAYDMIPPAVTINQDPAQADPVLAGPINFTVVFSEPVTDFKAADVTLSGTATGTKLVTVTAGSAGDTTYTVAVTGMTGSGTVIAKIPAGKAHDLAGNANLASTSTDNTVTYDVKPPTVTINQATSQKDPTCGSTVNFTVVFNEPVSDFAAGAVTLAGTAPGTLTATVTGPTGLPATTYTVAVTGMTGTGTVIATIPAGGVHDLAGNANLASTSKDNTITYDVTPPAVTVNQAATQKEWVKAGPINFTVVFSKPVIDFVAADVVLGGSAGAIKATVTGKGTTYTVAVSGMTVTGTVTADVAGGLAHDLAGNANLASTSTDNTVNYDLTPPTATIDQAAGQADSTRESPINYTVVFSEPVADFKAAAVVLSGAAKGNKVTVTGAVGGTTYNVAVSGMTASGPQIAAIAAGKVHDLAGNANLASTSTDNSVTFDAIDLAPTDVNLSNTNAPEAQPAGLAVGTLSSTDDLGNTFTYTLVTGAGNTDNGLFSISGNTLKTKAILNYATKSSLSIRIRTTDQGGLWFEKPFTLTVIQANDLPVLANIVNSLGRGTTLPFAATDFAAAFSEQVAGDSLSKIKIVTLPTAGKLLLSGVAVKAGDEIDVSQLGNLTYTAAATAGSISFTWNAADESLGLYAAKTALVKLTVL